MTIARKIPVTKKQKTIMVKSQMMNLAREKWVEKTNELKVNTQPKGSSTDLIRSILN